MTYTSELIEQIINFDADAIPSHVIEHAKLLVLDTIGCAVGGYTTRYGAQIVSQAKEFQGAGTACIIGDGSRISAPFAAWANSSLANILDMDDVYAGTAHQSNCLIPTALSMAQFKNASGNAVLQAIVLGFEVGSRIMMYSWPSPDMGQTYFPSTWQVFDAVTAAGFLLGADEQTLYHAFGLAGMVSPIPINMQKFVERPIGFAKNVFGWTTFTGIFWTMMAQKGVEGVADILDGEAGFWKMMGSGQHDFEHLSKEWGQSFAILETKFKPYPLCTWGHSSVDCFKQILEENSIKAKDIQNIHVKTIKRAVDFLADPKMNTLYDSQFSLPHALSMVALGKKPGPEWMSPKNMFQNPEASVIAAKVTMQADQQADRVFDQEKGLAIPTQVSVQTKGDQTFSKELKYSKGTINNPFTPEEIKIKFLELASSLFDDQQTREIMDCVLNLEKLDDISILMNLLSK
ncbi:MmgE/PrpD family protein [Desulfotignum balticum]|uniref:MmgE/PrpD family protein n=1 Tax=Desulfotignum balticum TaxID=115781 RepID=UPI000402D637|nr:MmgE/PrpD family protein [Desulfotignum balticum]